MRGALRRTARRLIRAALFRYARARPRAGAEPRVLIVMTSAWGMGGTIRAGINLAGYLAPRHDVEVISVVRRRESPFFPVAPGVKLTALTDLRPGAMRWPLRSLQRLLHKVPSSLMDPRDRAVRLWSLWVDIMMVRRLRRQTGFLITTRPGLNLLAADISPPGLITVGLEQMNLRVHRRPMRAQMKRLYPQLDALVVLTAEDEERYAKLLSSPPRLARIPNTVYSPDGATARLDAPTIVAAGRLTRQKGFGMLIRAFARVSADHPDWRLRICGGGPLERKLQAQIHRRGLADVVTLTGPVEHLGDEMANASIFALSSRAEGFPLVLIEAMSRGLGVVAFDCPTGPRDVIEDHVNGILVPPRDTKALAAGLREMIEDPELRRRCGAAALTTGRCYRIDAVGPRWDALLDELRATRARARARGGEGRRTGLRRPARPPRARRRWARAGTPRRPGRSAGRSGT
jgi:glycosyltransferase involved in cell wall biosynthesis